MIKSHFYIIDSTPFALENGERKFICAKEIVINVKNVFILVNGKVFYFFVYSLRIFPSTRTFINAKQSFVLINLHSLMPMVFIKINMTFFKMKRGLRIFHNVCLSEAFKLRSKVLQFFWKTWRKEFGTVSPMNIVTGLSAFEEEMEDYLLIADILGVNRSSARGILTFFINGDFGRETRLVCFLAGQYMFPTTKVTCFYVLTLLKSLNNRIIQILNLTLKLTFKTNRNT